MYQFRVPYLFTNPNSQKIAISDDESTWPGELVDSEEDIEFYENNKECNVCRQDIPEDFREKMIELFHGMSEEDPQTVHVLVHIHSKEAMDNFMQEAGEDIAKSGQILDSEEVTLFRK